MSNTEPESKCVSLSGLLLEDEPIVQALHRLAEEPSPVGHARLMQLSAKTKAFLETQTLRLPT